MLSDDVLTESRRIRVHRFAQPDRAPEATDNKRCKRANTRSRITDVAD